MSFGIPYARKEHDEQGWYAICPVCGEQVRLYERKDFESFSGSEYAAHYATQHANSDKLA